MRYYWEGTGAAWLPPAGRLGLHRPPERSWVWALLFPPLLLWREASLLGRSPRFDDLKSTASPWISLTLCLWLLAAGSALWLRFPAPELDRVWGWAQETLAAAALPSSNVNSTTVAVDTTQAGVPDSTTVGNGAAQAGRMASQGWDTVKHWWVLGQHGVAMVLVDLRSQAPFLRMALLAGLGILCLAFALQAADRLRQRVVLRHLEAALGAVLGSRPAPGGRRLSLFAINAAAIPIGLVAAMLLWLQVDPRLLRFIQIQFSDFPAWRPGWVLPALLAALWLVLLLVLKMKRYGDLVFLESDGAAKPVSPATNLPSVILEGRIQLAQRAPGSPLSGATVNIESLANSRGLLRRLALLHGIGLLREAHLAPGGAWAGILKWTEPGRQQIVEQALVAADDEEEAPAALSGLDPKKLVRLLCRVMYLTAQAGGRAVGTRQNRVFSQFCLNHSVALLLTKSEILLVLKALPKEDWSYLGGEDAANVLKQERARLQDLPTVREYCDAWISRGHRNVTEEWPRAARDDFDPLSNGVFQDLNMSVARLFDLLVEAVAFSDHALNEDEQAILVALGKAVDTVAPAEVLAKGESTAAGSSRRTGLMTDAAQVRP